MATRRVDMYAARDIAPGEVLQRRTERDGGDEAAGGTRGEDGGGAGGERDEAEGRETRPWRVHVAARTGTVEDSDTGSEMDGESEDGEGWETGDEMEEWEEGPPREVVPERDK